MKIAFINSAAYDAVSKLSGHLYFGNLFEEIIWRAIVYKTMGHSVEVYDNDGDILYEKCVFHNARSPIKVSLQQVTAVYQRNRRERAKKLGFPNDMCHQLGVAGVNSFLAYASGNIKDNRDKDLLSFSGEGMLVSDYSPKIAMDNKPVQASNDFLASVLPYKETQEDFTIPAQVLKGDLPDTPYANMALNVVRLSKNNKEFIKAILIDDFFYDKTKRIKYDLFHEFLKIPLRERARAAYQKAINKDPNLKQMMVYTDCIYKGYVANLYNLFTSIQN